jgi:hypothetical protein
MGDPLMATTDTCPDCGTVLQLSTVFDEDFNKCPSARSRGRSSTLRRRGGASGAVSDLHGLRDVGDFLGLDVELYVPDIAAKCPVDLVRPSAEQLPEIWTLSDRKVSAPAEVLLDFGERPVDVCLVDASALAVEDDLRLQVDLRTGDRVLGCFLTVHNSPPRSPTIIKESPDGPPTSGSFDRRRASRSVTLLQSIPSRGMTFGKAWTHASHRASNRSGRLAPLSICTSRRARSCVRSCMARA